MIRFIRDPQPPYTQFKQGMVRDLGTVLEASFISSGDAVAYTEADAVFPPSKQLVAPGGSRDDPVRGFTAAKQAAIDALVSGAGKSVVGYQRVHRSMPNPTTDVTGGVAKSIDVQIPAKRSYFGYRLGYINLNTNSGQGGAGGSANYTLAKAGGAAKHLASMGSEISWAVQQVLGSNTISVPLGRAGAAQPIWNATFTDYCNQASVARSDSATFGNKPLLRVRSRTAVESQWIYTLGGNANWNAFPGNGGMLFGAYVTNTDLVTTTNDSASVLENGAGAQPIIALFNYVDPVRNWWALGDSRTQGKGSSVTAGADALAGWAILVHCQSSSVDVLDVSVSGQQTLDSIAIAMAMLATFPELPYGLAITVLSPNDPISQAQIDTIWGAILELIRAANKLGVRVMLLSCAPVDNWNGTQHTLCETQNARALAQANSSPNWVRFLDMKTIIADPANSRAINPAYRIAGEAPGYTHWNDAGFQAVATTAMALMAA